jgi:hypothetical protein
MDSIPGEMRWDLCDVRYESVVDKSIDREFSSLFGTVDFVFTPVPTAAMVETAGDPGKIFFWSIRVGVVNGDRSRLLSALAIDSIVI